MLFATTFPIGRSTGLLQAFALSPSRAAFRLLLMKMAAALPEMIVPLLLGVLSGGGVWLGVFVPVLSTIAAHLCSMITFALRFPS